MGLEEISPEILPAISQLAIQRTLADIVQRLEVIDQKISDVLEGQRNDRLAIVDSGVHLYQQAIAANDSTTRCQLLTSAIQQLNEGRQRLIATLETEVKFVDRIPRKPWQVWIRSLFSDMPALVKAKAIPIQKSLQAVLRASCVLCLAYEALGEPDALRVSLQPLREVVFRIGERGERIARWLSYDPTNPPEELWHRLPLQLADGIEQTLAQVESIHLKAIEIQLMPSEIGPGEIE